MDYTLNCNGRLISLAKPQVMGILNVTPDSFYAASREMTEQGVVHRVEQILSEGATMIDVGACSTRPGSEPANEAEEMERLRWALPIVRREAAEAAVSVDTFRPQVARMAVEEFGVDIINDVGSPVSKTFESSNHNYHPTAMQHMVARLRVPYIYMSRKATMEEIILDCVETIGALRSMGQKDIILDPGFGFGKTPRLATSMLEGATAGDYSVMQKLERLQMVGLPILVGVSRKSMLYRLLGCLPEDALNGTTILHTIALAKGANILRVHDVKAATEAIRIMSATCRSIEDDK